MKRILAFLTGIVLLSSCTDYEGTADPLNTEGSVCLFNGIGDVGTLSVISGGGIISNDVLSLGKWPNHIFFDSGVLYVVNSGNNNVQMIDAASQISTGSVELTPYSNPMRAAVSNRKLYATNSFGSGIDVYDFDKDSLYTILITGVPDSCMNGGTDAVLAFGSRIYAGVRNITYDEFWNAVCGPEYIAVIDTQADTVITSFEAGINIADMIINEENELHVLSTGNRSDVGGFVRVYDLAAAGFSSYSTVELGSQPGSLALDGDGMVYAGVSGMNPDWSGFGGIMKYNSIDNAVINGAGSMIFTSETSGILDICTDNEGKVYAPLFDDNALLILEKDSVVSTLVTGNGPQGLVFVPEQ